MNIGALAEQIADRVAERVLAQLGRVPVKAVRPLAYTSHKDGPGLPGKTRRWMIDHMKNIPGVRKVGRDWVISVADYDTWCVAEDYRQCARAKRKPPVKAPADLPISSRAAEKSDLELRAQRSLQVGNRRSK